MKTMYLQKGASLLEVLMVVAIIGFMITVGAPSISESQQTARMQGAVETSYFALQSARANAISSGQDTTVSFNTAGNWCIGFSDAGNCNCGTANSCTINGVESVIAQADYTGISLQEVNFPTANQMMFDSQRGLALNNAGSFVFEDARDNEVRLEVNNMGRVKICIEDGQFGNYAAC